jgi:hypothetical protein
LVPVPLLLKSHPCSRFYLQQEDVLVVLRKLCRKLEPVTVARLMVPAASERFLWILMEFEHQSVPVQSLLGPWWRNSGIILHCTQTCKCSDLFRNNCKDNVAGSRYVTLQNVFFRRSKNLPWPGVSANRLSRSSSVHFLLLTRLFSDES